MTDVFEEHLRGALADRASLVPPEASVRLRAIDYHPRSRRFASRPALGALGLTGGAAAAAAILLASSAAPAFAGWTASPTSTKHAQLAAADRNCSTGAGTPVLTDTRGPYTASIWADGSTCIEGNGMTISSRNTGGGTSGVSAGTIGLWGAGESDSDGHALTMVDGPVGAGVTGVSITRSDGSSVKATVQNGWYLAWWPGTEHALTAQVASASGTRTQAFPTGGPAGPAPNCPSEAYCSTGYGFGSAPGQQDEKSTTQITAPSVSGQ